MKRNLVAAFALLTTSFMPIAMMSPAFADTVSTPFGALADATTLAAMQDQCTALAALHGPASGDNDQWSGQVVEGNTTLIAGPTEVGGTRSIDHNSIVGTGTYVPSAREIRGNPFKNGGSVNMFGDQWSTAGFYPDSTYNFTANFNSTFAHAFSCNIQDAVYHPPVDHPAVPVQGFYTNPGTEPSHGEGSCQGVGPDNPHWGASFGACEWHETAPAHDAYTDPAYWDAPVTVAHEPGIAINQDQTDTLNGFEDHGGIVQVTGEYHVGQPVICISPGSKGGSWRTQNGYGGGSLSGPAAGCNTPYFKIAPWGNGSQTSNGTFTSVPNYHL